jgi:hypothetical protein
MIAPRRRSGVVGLPALISVGMTVLCASRGLGVQTPHQAPVRHERQCVATGEIPPGDARTITVTWKHPFASGEYDIIGSVSESGDRREAIELGHIVIPHTPTTAAAIVLNRNATETHSAILCLDASSEQ